MTTLDYAPRRLARLPLPASAREGDDEPVAPRRFAPIRSAFARDVLAGLSRPRKAIPFAWLYDRAGAQLFERVALREAYYPAHAERAILLACAPQIAAAAGPGAVLVELGSGAALGRTALLLAALEAPSACVPIDLCAETLAESQARLAARFPGLPLHPIAGDLGAPATLEPLRRSARALSGGRRWPRRVGFMPGALIGNYASDAAQALLARLGQVLGDDALLVVGVDGTLDRARLAAAYDDAEGLMARFDKNLLARIDRELEGDFDPNAFRHEARFDAGRQRIELHLVARTWDSFEVLGRRFGWAAGESIHTQNSHKYSRGRFELLASRAGWAPLQFWSDAGSGYAVHVLERAR